MMRAKTATQLLTVVLLFSSCNWVKDKSRETVNKTGEVVAQTGSEFVNGMSKGIVKTFRNKVVFSDALVQSGLSCGKTLIGSTDSGKDNLLSVYFIFNKAFDHKVLIKLFTEDGEEYGRASLHLKGLQDEARYEDVVFDKRTQIDSRSKITVE